MATAAKQAFTKNIERARYFLDIHEEVHSRVGAPPAPYRELPRGAIVFAVGALDAYTSEVSAEVLVAQLRAGGSDKTIRSVLAHVQREVPTLPLEVALRRTEKERMEHIRAAIVDHFHENVTAIGSSAVAQAVRRMGRDAKDLWSALEGEGLTRPSEKLETWANVRHRIVHRGETTRVDRNKARNFIYLTMRVVSTMDRYAEEAITAAGR